MRVVRQARLMAGIVGVFLVAVLLEGCLTRESNAESGPGTPAEGEGTQGVLVRGGSVVRRGGPKERLDLLLERHQQFLVLAAAAEPGQLEAGDTLDVSGLYIHSTNAIHPRVETTPSREPRSSIAMYVVRTGVGPGSTAKWLIGPSRVQAVEPAENHPARLQDERVGCYTVERGSWSDPSFELDMPLWFPDTLRLHWQLHWPIGPSPYLVATDIDGRVQGETTTYYKWSPVGEDSVRVAFGPWWGGTSFQGAATARDYAGDLTVWHHQGLSVRAPARLRRFQCPNMN